MPDETPIPPVVEKTVQTTETTKAASLKTPAADDRTRKVLAAILVTQWALIMCYTVFKHIGLDAVTLNAENMVLTFVLGYYYGSSSGSTAKNG